MKRILCLLAITLISTLAMAQTRVYRGRSTMSSDILYTWDGKQLYRGRSTMSSDIIYTVEGNLPPILMALL